MSSKIHELPEGNRLDNNVKFLCVCLLYQLITFCPCLKTNIWTLAPFYSDEDITNSRGIWERPQAVVTFDPFHTSELGTRSTGLDCMGIKASSKIYWRDRERRRGGDGGVTTCRMHTWKSLMCFICLVNTWTTWMWWSQLACMAGASRSLLIIDCCVVTVGLSKLTDILTSCPSWLAILFVKRSSLPSCRARRRETSRVWSTSEYHNFHSSLFYNHFFLLP